MNKSTLNVTDLFADIPISEEEKSELIGIYLVSIYKTMLELIIAFSGNKKDFVNDLEKFFEKSLSALEEKQRKIFDGELESQKKVILKKLSDIIKENVGDNLGYKIDENYDRLTAKLATEDNLK